MEKEFQTSFIPKKPLAEERGQAPVRAPAANIFNVIAVIVFLIAAVGAGATYFYKLTLQKQVESARQSLIKARNEFEPSTVADLQALDKRITASREIIRNHIVMAPIFQDLSTLTLQSIRFTKFTYAITGTGATKAIDIKMSGVAQNYNALAVQSDIFGNYKYFRDPVFSNLSIDDKKDILFDLSFSLDPKHLDYSANLPLSSDQALPAEPVVGAQ